MRYLLHRLIEMLIHEKNTTLMKMFNLINVGERAGSGIPSIYDVWKKQGWPEPVLTEAFSPERITMTLSLVNEKKTAIKSGDKKVAIKAGGKITAQHKERVLQYLTEYTSASCVDLAGELHLKVSRVRELLAQLQAEGYVVAVGNNRNRTYQLQD